MEAIQLRRSHYWLVVQAFLLLPALDLFAQHPSREQRVEVTAVDYALNLPEMLAHGTHRWTFENKGNVRHEFIIARLGPNVDTHAAVDSLHARGFRAFFPGSPALGVAGAALLAGPDHKADGEIVTRDRAGDILLVFCQLRDGEGKPKHDEMGMFKLVRIR